MSLKFLFVPADGVGHVNAHTGIGQELVIKGHSVYFAISNSWKGKLAPLGFMEKFYQEESCETNSVGVWNQIVENMRQSMALSPIEKMEQIVPSMYCQHVANVKEADAKLRQIIAQVQPHLIVTDFICLPAVITSGIPWMIVASHNPLGITTENSPPAFSGISFSADKAVWNKFRETEKRVLGPILEDLSEWALTKGVVSKFTFDGRSIWTPDSPYGNLYMYPKELDYTSHRPNLPNWYQFDTFMRFEPHVLESPEKLRDGPGKLIYFSLGTIGCSEHELMTKLITFLGKSPNRIIVSTGPTGHQLELADNMRGGNNLPQTNILPLVDLVITHGGNNTLTESFYFGKKVIVLPLFCDQLDNATRVEETGLGLQLNPYKVTQEMMLNGIETLLKDDLLEKRMRQISVRMKAANSQARAAELLENVASNNAPNRN